MAETIRFLMAPEDEAAFLRYIARFKLKVYPARVPPSWQAFIASDLTLGDFPGRLWAELEVTPQTGRRNAAPERFRQIFMEIQAWLKRTHRRSEPKGFWIGPGAARRFKQGLRLRDCEPKGSLVQPYG